MEITREQMKEDFEIFCRNFEITKLNGDVSLSGKEFLNEGFKATCELYEIVERDASNE